MECQKDKPIKFGLVLEKDVIIKKIRTLIITEVEELGCVNVGKNLKTFLRTWENVQKV